MKKLTAAQLTRLQKTLLAAAAPFAVVVLLGANAGAPVWLQLETPDGGLVRAKGTAAGSAKTTLEGVSVDMYVIPPSAIPTVDCWDEDGGVPGCDAGVTLYDGGGTYYDAATHPIHVTPTGDQYASLVSESGTPVGTQAAPLYCDPATYGTSWATPMAVEMFSGGLGLGTVDKSAVVAGVDLAGTSAAAPYVDTLGNVANRAPTYCASLAGKKMLSLAAGAQGYVDLDPYVIYEIRLQSGEVCLDTFADTTGWGDAGTPCSSGAPYLNADHPVREFPFYGEELIGGSADAGQIGARVHVYAAGQASVVRFLPRVPCRVP